MKHIHSILNFIIHCTLYILGQTPPCASTFIKAGVKRVVVGFRDPNPRVDGGGVSLLQNAGIRVDLLLMEKEDECIEKEERESAFECANIVNAFAKRITRRTEENGGVHILDYESNINGAKRSALRSLAGKWKKEGTMTEFYWPSYCDSITKADVDGGDIDLNEAIDSLTIDHGWLEIIDSALWEKELILLRMNNAVAKKKGAKLLGQRIATELKAHVAQVVGHTVLLYRPGLPPTLDLDELVIAQQS